MDGIYTALHHSNLPVNHLVASEGCRSMDSIGHTHVLRNSTANMYNVFIALAQMASLAALIQSLGTNAIPTLIKLRRFLPSGSNNF